MKRILSVIVIVGIMAGAAGCEAKTEALSVPTLAEHNELVAVVNQHKEVLDNIQARIDELAAEMMAWSEKVVDIHDGNVEVYNEQIDAMNEWSDEIAAIVTHNANILNEVIEYLNR